MLCFNRLVLVTAGTVFAAVTGLGLGGYLG